jgi:hypothetical protein
MTSGGQSEPRLYPLMPVTGTGALTHLDGGADEVDEDERQAGQSQAESVGNGARANRTDHSTNG